MTYIYKILSFFLSLIPKSKRILVFSSFPDYTDNAYAFYKYLVSKHKEEYDLIWIFAEKTTLQENQNVRAYYKYTVRAIYYFCRARYVFCTHGLYSFLDLHQGLKIVNLWHGMPIKTIGCLDPQNAGINPTMADYLIASSPMFQEIMSKAFNNMPLERVLLTGQPRNDLLFETTDFFKKRNINSSKYKSIGIWLPTYKQSFVGDIRQDGVYNQSGISFLSISNLVSLDEFLVKTNNLLIVKLHPMDILQNYNFPEFRNLLIIKQKDFKDQLYPLLGACSYLLTDYSSVWVDYNILRRPIGFVMNDFEEYIKSRGFTINNLVDKIPGQIIDTYQKLIHFILYPLVPDSERTSIYNSFADSFSSERVYQSLFK